MFFHPPHFYCVTTLPSKTNTTANIGVLMPMLRGSQGWLFSFSEKSGAVSRVHLTWAPICSLDDHYVQYSAKRVLNRTLRTQQVFVLDKGVYNFLDSVIRALEFKFLALLLTIKPVSPIFALKQTSCLPFNS